MQKLIIACGLLFAITAHASDSGPVWTAEKSMRLLRDGNARFVSGKPNRWNSGEKRRQELTGGQTPYACIIACADSRVPPEQIFDCGLGELFVIRVAGNVTPVEVVASADYAVGHLHCPVVVVMGHTRCGAVGAALSDSDFLEPLKSLIGEIEPSVAACESKGYEAEALYDGAIRENARNGAMSLLAGSRAIDEAVAAGECVVLSAVYDIESGEVNWLSQVTAPQEEPAKSLHAESKPTEHKEQTAEHPVQEATRKSISTTKSRH
ncbi:MAG: carbonic anhydrase [Calditrichaeota bacterium]|nr:carbonic anhydrase [Calditrichota bacterium]